MRLHDVRFILTEAFAVFVVVWLAASVLYS